MAGFISIPFDIWGLWKTEALAEGHGIQLLSIFIAALGLGTLYF